MSIKFDHLDPVASTTPSDYLSNFNPNEVLKDPRFLDDLRKYFERRGERYSSDDELVKAFYSDRA